MKHMLTRVIALGLAVVLCLSAAGPLTALATDPEMPTADMKTVLNSATLYPQRTGYKEIDEGFAAILNSYSGADTYTKALALYDWAVKNIRYSWDGYSKKAPLPMSTSL